MTEYEYGEAVALSFKINTVRGEIGIKLPSNIDKVLRVLKNQKQNNTTLKLKILKSKQQELHGELLKIGLKHKWQYWKLKCLKWKRYSCHT